MANRRRGEVPLTLGAERYTLCLTLGALAELEHTLQAGDIVGLAERFSQGRLAARDLIALLGAALRGGGHDITDEAIAHRVLAGDLFAVSEAIAAALVAAFGEAEPERPEKNP